MRSAFLKIFHFISLGADFVSHDFVLGQPTFGEHKGIGPFKLEYVDAFIDLLVIDGNVPILFY